jgi:diacylglycerol kinase family enzyme
LPTRTGISFASGRSGPSTPSKALSDALLIVNPSSGDETPTADDLVAAAKRLGVEGHVLRPGEDASEVAREAARRGSEVVGIAAGDGSLGSVAAVTLERDLAFVCVPFGTRNHFARDLGLDRDDPLAALAAFDGRERRVDVGLVNGRVFVNNVSLGIYAFFVHDAEKKTRNRLTAFLRMAPAALGRSRRPLDLSFEVDGVREHHLALVALVANNDYRMTSMADLGERTRLDEGRLHAYVIGAVSRRALLGMLARAAVGKIEQTEGWVEWSAAAVRVDSNRPRLHAALDGDPIVLEPPLEFEIRPQALRVLLPVS